MKKIAIIAAAALASCATPAFANNKDIYAMEVCIDHTANMRSGALLLAIYMGIYGNNNDAVKALERCTAYLNAKAKEMQERNRALGYSD